MKKFFVKFTHYNKETDAAFYLVVDSIESIHIGPGGKGSLIFIKANPDPGSYYHVHESPEDILFTIGNVIHPL